MKKEIIHVPIISDALKKTGVPLSPIVKAGGMLYVSGLPPMDPKTGMFTNGDIKTQTELCLEALKKCLEAAGSSLENVVKVTIYCVNTAYFDDVNEVYRRYFGHDAPARVFCGVTPWPKKFDLEIDCIAIG